MGTNLSFKEEAELKLNSPLGWEDIHFTLVLVPQAFLIAIILLSKLCLLDLPGLKSQHYKSLW